MGYPKVRDEAIGGGWAALGNAEWDGYGFSVWAGCDTVSRYRQGAGAGCDLGEAGYGFEPPDDAIDR